MENLHWKLHWASWITFVKRVPTCLEKIKLKSFNGSCILWVWIRLCYTHIFQGNFFQQNSVFFIGDAMSSSLAWVLHKKDKKAKDMLNKMETYLSTRTFLAGERLTLADISLAMVYLPLYQYVMNANLRSKYPNNTRWFNTCIHQSNFLKVLGNVKLCGDKWLYF